MANYRAGLQVIDITNPASPQPIGAVDTPHLAQGVAISEDHAYVADGYAGLRVASLQCETEVSVYLMGLHARRLGSSCVVSWSIGQPQANVGIRVWRQSADSALAMLGEAELRGPDSYVFIDEVAPASAAQYWLEEVTTDGSVNWYGPAHLSAAVVPATLALRQNQPNPFNPQTTLR